MLMNRIGPSSAEIADADGSGERKLLRNSIFEHNACFAPDGKSVLFTSERNGPGQSDVFRARLDGTGIEPLLTGPAVDDAAALSPDGTRLAFVSTRNGYRANIWIRDLQRGEMRNLTGAGQGDPSGPDRRSTRTSKMDHLLHSRRGRARELATTWGCPACLLNIAKRSLPKLILRGVGLASNDAVG